VRRLASNIAFGLHVAFFAVVCVGALPVLLFMFGVNWVRDQIDARWPDSDRARAVRFWIGCLAPPLLLLIMLVITVIAALRVHELRAGRG
jgi:hypothetical protein